MPPEHPAAINGAVLKLPREHTVLKDLIQHARSVVDLNQHWGVIGPRLITPKFNESGLSKFASARAEYYPISHFDFWKVLLPDERENVELAARTSKLLHLWHHMFEISGYNKQLAPPKGSYLHDAFERVGALHQFCGSYDARELRLQLDNWLPAELKAAG